jgi:alkylhydroperoxidase family enzyme
MKVVRRPEDCAGSPQETQQLFDLLFPQGGERVFRGGQQGWGLVAAHGPRTALLVAQLTKQIAAGPFLAARPDLREIAIQSVNLHFRCDFSFRSHLMYLSKVGLSLETIAALPYWRTSSLFDAEQKLVIAYTLAVISADVPDSLHTDAVDEFGEGAVAELAFAVAHCSFWAMFLNAAQLDIDADAVATS